MNIFIAAYIGFGNAGDEAVLASLLRSLRSAHPSLDICVMSDAPDVTQRLYGVRSAQWTDLRETAAAIQEADLVIIGGGGILDFGHPASGVELLEDDNQMFSQVILRVPVLAALFGKRCIAYAVGARCPRSEEEAKSLKLFAGLCTQVFVRDLYTLNLLKSVGCNMKRVRKVPDPAITLKASESSIQNSSGSRPLIGVTLVPPSVKSSSRDILFEIKNAIVRYHRSSGCSVVLLPFFVGREVDDREALLGLQRSLETEGVPVSLSPPMAPENIVSQIARCDLMLGMRFHSVVLSLANGVPCVGLAYEPKISSLMSELRLQDYVLPVEQIESDSLYRLICAANYNKRGLSSQIRQRVATLRQEALRSMGELLAYRSPRSWSLQDLFPYSRLDMIDTTLLEFLRSLVLNDLLRLKQK